MPRLPLRPVFAFSSHLRRRLFSQTPRSRTIRDISELPARTYPSYKETKHADLLCVQWPSPLRNVLLTKKECSAEVTESFVEYAKHIAAEYPDVSIVLERRVAEDLQGAFSFPVYAALQEKAKLSTKVDLVSTLGGDGTILRASSLFATTSRVPPILSFSMGTLGFLGEWKFQEYKRAFREVYMSGAGAGYGSAVIEHAGKEDRVDGSASAEFFKHGSLPDRPDEDRKSGWSGIRGKSMGSHRGARVLLRNRLKVGLFNPDGSRIANPATSAGAGDIYALNEVILHRGADPHLAIIEVFIGGRFLTEAVADGMIISSPTGSTAYSLSSGGSIVHPLVPALLLTPICPRSLSFRPLVLPSNTPITLRLSEKNRSRDVEVSIDGVRREGGIGIGVEVRVVGEEIARGPDGWIGGVPSIVRANGVDAAKGQDHWVGGLNGLLKFNYPFGEERE